MRINCPKNPEHGLLLPSPIQHRYKVTRGEFSLEIGLHGAPGQVCRTCLEQGTDTAVLDERLDNLFSQKVNAALARTVESHLAYFQFPIQKVVFDFSGDLGRDSQHKDTSDDLLTVRSPSWRLDRIYLPDTVRQRINAIVNGIRHSQVLFDDWGIRDIHRSRSFVLNFSGPSGTGKSITVEGVANEIGRSLLEVNYSQLESKYVGETPKNIRRAFRIAAAQQAVLLFDEADSFLSKRVTEITQSADYAVNISRSVMLQELETFEGIVFFATNLIKNYDKAFERRILEFIEFAMPDENGREAIVKILTPPSLPVAGDVTAAKIASVTRGFAGGDLKKLIVSAALTALTRKAASRDETVQVERSDVTKSVEEIKLARTLMGPDLEVVKVSDEVKDEDSRARTRPI